ncbi:LOW QUALITY PROTEIN: uncharacterized protein LOC129591553 [Paramacrobiotus metropolitanus]|uniref:LOW QUALITY PROTEIN: uncharacterized protein LOC129591553 n=1 Tax=Paramacrobiotus metropolitanus TaxID=2943436 RepID=UPI002445AAED|nr:LOW QUALITY PROTEIN: uncharacterized protein LOC129591553 [Paramacrobiotus metropolitanus]
MPTGVTETMVRNGNDHSQHTEVIVKNGHYAGKKLFASPTMSDRTGMAPISVPEGPPDVKGGSTEGNASFLRAARAGNIEKVQEYLRQGTDINTANANGLNALHLASKEGHVELVRLLLKHGASVDAATKKGNTALHIACLAGQYEIVRILIEHGAAVNVQSQNGFTPLYMAAQENHFDIVKHLLENNANQSLATEDGFTPLAVALQQGHDKVVSILLENDTRSKVRLPALHIAAKKDDVKAATLLLDADPNADVTSKSGFTPLHIAAHYGNANIANLLLDKKADVNYAASKHMITPLHVAAKWGRPAMVQLLLDRGAQIDAKTRDGLTPLHCGARSGHDRVVDILLQKGSPNNPKTKNGLAPLHMAAQGDHVDSARALLYYKAPVDDVTVDYLTPLHVAAHCGHVRVAKLLLDRRADPNARALNGFTPLHIACKKNRIKVVELLLKHNASIEYTTESGLTPLHVASFMGCMNIVLYLIQHGSNPDVTTVRGETPLHLAVRSNQTDIIRILLRNGAKVDARARENQTPLHIAVRLGHMDNMALLLQHGAVVDTQTKDLYTPLHIAAKEGQEECAAALIEQGANINAVTRKGFTPLHLAAKYGHIGVVRLLLDKGSPVDSPGKNGVTPLHVAAHYDNVQVAHLLLQRGASPLATAKNGYTPLHISAKKNQLDIAHNLLKFKSDPNAESKAGFTPVHLAAQEGHAEMLQLLLANGGAVNQRAKNGLTPMHLAAQEDHVPVAEVLVQHGAEINPETKAGYTPLHVASHFGQLNMVRYLLDQGADVNVKTSYGYTPLHQAAQQGHTQVINVLLQHQAQPNEINNQGQTALSIAEKLGYVSVVETLKVVTETIVTTTTTTVTEEKFKVLAPETMQEAFISDSEDEADRHLDEEEETIERHGDASVSPPRSRSSSRHRSRPPPTTVHVEEHVYVRDVPSDDDDTERATRRRVHETTENLPPSTSVRETRRDKKVTKDIKRSRSPDYHKEFLYEGSGFTGHSDEQYMETVIRHEGLRERPNSDYRQYETTVTETEHITSSAIPRAHVPDVVVLNERHETRAASVSPTHIPLRVDSPGEIVVEYDRNVPQGDIVERYKLVSPPPIEEPVEKHKKRKWFSFGSGDKDKPASEKKDKKKNKKDKEAEKLEEKSKTLERNVRYEQPNREEEVLRQAAFDREGTPRNRTREILDEAIQEATLEADRRGRGMSTPKPHDDTIVHVSESSAHRMVPDASGRPLPGQQTVEVIREGVHSTQVRDDNLPTDRDEHFIEKSATWLHAHRNKKPEDVEHLEESHVRTESPAPVRGGDGDNFNERPETWLHAHRAKKPEEVERLEENRIRTESPQPEIIELPKRAKSPRKDKSKERPPKGVQVTTEVGAESLAETSGVRVTKSPQVGTTTGEHLVETTETIEGRPTRITKHWSGHKEILENFDKDSEGRSSRDVTVARPMHIREHDHSVERLQEDVYETTIDDGNTSKKSKTKSKSKEKTSKVKGDSKVSLSQSTKGGHVYHYCWWKAVTAIPVTNARMDRTRGQSANTWMNRSYLQEHQKTVGDRPRAPYDGAEREYVDESVTSSSTPKKIRERPLHEPYDGAEREYVGETVVTSGSPKRIRERPHGPHDGAEREYVDEAVTSSGTPKKVRERPLGAYDNAGREILDEAVLVTTGPGATKPPKPKDRTIESLREATHDSSGENTPRKQKKQLWFAGDTRRSASTSSTSSSSSESSTSSSSESEVLDADGKLKRKSPSRSPVKKIRKPKKEKIAYEAVPTDEQLVEGVVVTKSEKVKKPKDKSHKKTKATRKTNISMALSKRRRSTMKVAKSRRKHYGQNVRRTFARTRQRRPRVYENGGSARERLHEMALSGRQPVTETYVRSAEGRLDSETMEYSTSYKNGHPERPLATPTSITLHEKSFTHEHDEPTRDKVTKTPKELEEDEKARKKNEKERKKRERKEQQERERLEKEQRSAAKKREKLEKEERERLEKEEKKRNKEKAKNAKAGKDKVEVVIAEGVTQRELDERQDDKSPKPLGHINLAERVDHIRSADSSTESSRAPSRSQSSQPFSPVSKTTPTLIRDDETLRRSQTPTLLRAQHEASVERSPSGVSRSKSPGKAVVELRERVTKGDTGTLPRKPASEDAVQLYETPWLPLNRDEDYPPETFGRTDRSQEPAVSPPDMTLNYMQDDRHFQQHPIDTTGNVYISGYSEGKMSPHVEGKISPHETTPTRVIDATHVIDGSRVTDGIRVHEGTRVESTRVPEMPTRVEISEHVRREEVYPEPGPKKPGHLPQRGETYEQIMRDVERRKHEPGYQSAVHGYEPEVREDLHELEGTFVPDNVDLIRGQAPIHGGFLVSFLVDARGGAMRGCRHSGIRVIIPPRKAPCPMRITCKYLTKDKVANPPPLMEGEGLACRILEMGPSSAKFLGPVIVEIPHFASLRDGEREITILRSENGQTWREHTLEATEEAVQKVLNESFDPNELSAIEDLQTNRIVRILTTDFPLYFAIISRIKQEVHAVGPDGGVIVSTVENKVQALFPEGALTKKIKVGVQAHVVPQDLVSRLLGNRIAVSPIVTVEPRRRKFHKPITLTIPLPRAAGKGMVNQYTSDSPNLRLLCSITGGTNPAQWEDITGSTPLVIVNDCIQFTTTVSARFWLMDCGHNINEAVKLGHTIYADGCVVPFMAKFVVYARRFDNEEARLRVFCMTDDKEDKTLEHQERFVEVAKSRDVEVLEGKNLYIEMAGNLIPVTKSGEQLHLRFYPFQENRLPFLVKVKDPNEDAQGRLAFMKDSKSGRNEMPQIPICNLNVRLPDELSPMEPTSAKDIVTIVRRPVYMKEIGKAGSVHRADLRLHDVADLLGDDWPALALQLGFRDPEIQAIKNEEPKVQKQALIMLRRWVERRDQSRQAGSDLEQGLKRINRDDIVNKSMFNVKLLTDDVDRSMQRFSVDRDQIGFDALHEELGPSHEGTLDRTFVRDYAPGYPPKKAESESASETTSLHEEVVGAPCGPQGGAGGQTRHSTARTGRTASGRNENLCSKCGRSAGSRRTCRVRPHHGRPPVTNGERSGHPQRSIGDPTRWTRFLEQSCYSLSQMRREPEQEVLHETTRVREAPPSPPRRQVSQPTEEVLHESTRVREAPPSPPSRRDVSQPTQEVLHETTQVREAPPSPPARKQPPSPPRRMEPPVPPTRKEPPSPPERHEPTPTVVHTEERVIGTTEPVTRVHETVTKTVRHVGPGFLNKAADSIEQMRGEELEHERPQLSNEPVGDDDAQKTSSQQSYETVESEYDDDGNLVTKKTVTTVKTSRTTRTIIGDQDEIVKKATEGEFMRNVPGRRASQEGENLQETVTRVSTDTSGPEITDVTETFVKEAEEPHTRGIVAVSETDYGRHLDSVLVAPHPSPAITPSASQTPLDVTSSILYEVNQSTSLADRERIESLPTAPPRRPKGQRNAFEDLERVRLESSSSSVVSHISRKVESDAESAKTFDDNMSYATARESLSESSLYYTARESISGDSVSTLISDQELKQLESDAESVFSAMTDREYSEPPESHVYHAERESTPTNISASLERLNQTVAYVSPSSPTRSIIQETMSLFPEEEPTSPPKSPINPFYADDTDFPKRAGSVVYRSTAERQEETATTVEETKERISPYAAVRRASLQQQTTSNIEHGQEVKQQTVTTTFVTEIKPTIPSSPVPTPSSETLRNERETIEVTIQPREEHTFVSAVQTPRTFNVDVLRESVSVSPTRKEFAQTLPDVPPGGLSIHPDISTYSETIESTMQDMIRNLQTIRGEAGLSELPPRVSSPTEVRFRMSNSNLEDFSMSQQVDRATVEQLLDYYTSPKTTRRSSNQRSHTEQTTASEMIIHTDIEQTVSSSSPPAESPYPGEFLRRFIAERDRARPHWMKRPLGVVINPDSPEFVKQMAAVIEEENRAQQSRLESTSDSEFLSRRAPFYSDTTAQGSSTMRETYSYQQKYFGDESGEIPPFPYPSDESITPEMYHYESLPQYQYEYTGAHELKKSYKDFESEAYASAGTTVFTVEEEKVTVQTRTMAEGENVSQHISATSTSGLESAQERLFEQTFVRDLSEGSGLPAVQSALAHIQGDTDLLADSITHTADELVQEAVTAALDELSAADTTGSQTTVRNLSSEYSGSSASQEEEIIKQQRPTHLFAAAQQPHVTFTGTIPIIETPSSQHPHFPRTPEHIHRSPSPVEVTEITETVATESGAATPIVQEPEELPGRERRESGSSVKSEPIETPTVVRTDDDRERLTASAADSGLTVSDIRTASTISGGYLQESLHEVADTFDENLPPTRRERTPIRHRNYQKNAYGHARISAPRPSGWACVSILRANSLRPNCESWPVGRPMSVCRISSGDRKAQSHRVHRPPRRRRPTATRKR